MDKSNDNALPDDYSPRGPHPTLEELLIYIEALEKRHKKAINYIQMDRDIDPDDVSIALQEEGRDEEAEQLFRRCVTLSTSMVLALEDAACFRAKIALIANKANKSLKTPLKPQKDLPPGK